jgi:hypothetical protein
MLCSNIVLDFKVYKIITECSLKQNWCKDRFGFFTTNKNQAGKLVFEYYGKLIFFSDVTPLSIEICLPSKQ